MAITTRSAARSHLTSIYICKLTSISW